MKIIQITNEIRKLKQNLYAYFHHKIYIPWFLLPDFFSYLCKAILMKI